MDDVPKLLEELLGIAPHLENVALQVTLLGEWRVVITLPRGTTRRIRIVHLPYRSTADEALADAREFVMPRGDAAA